MKGYALHFIKVRCVDRKLSIRHLLGYKLLEQIYASLYIKTLSLHIRYTLKASIITVSYKSSTLEIKLNYNNKHQNRILSLLYLSYFNALSLQTPVQHTYDGVELNVLLSMVL